MAASTWEASTLPDEQAEPALTAMPARSSAITSVSALAPGTAMQAVFGRRGTLPENTTASAAMARTPSSSASLSLAISSILARSAAASSAATPKPTMPANVLGAGAAPAFLTAALDEGLDGHAFGENERADAFRSAHLVGRQAHHVGAQLGHVERHAAGRLNGVAMQQPAGVVDDLGGLGHGLNGARLVIGRHQGDDRPPAAGLMLLELLRRARRDRRRRRGVTGMRVVVSG